MIGALGLTLIFGVMKIANLTHGAMYALGAFIHYSLVEWLGVPFVPALFIAALAGRVALRTSILPGYGCIARSCHHLWDRLIDDICQCNHKYLGRLAFANSDPIQLCVEDRGGSHQFA
jgi:hypothetical protein